MFKHFPLVNMGHDDDVNVKMMFVKMFMNVKMIFSATCSKPPRIPLKEQFESLGHDQVVKINSFEQ